MQPAIEKSRLPIRKKMLDVNNITAWVLSVNRRTAIFIPHQVGK
jgi:hypothetical protein